jgi:predicted nucleic acid-binding protein
MCVIIDANLAGKVFATPCDGDFKPLWDWVFDKRKQGSIVFGGHLAEELCRIRSVREGGARALSELKRAGRAHEIRKDCVEREENIVGSLKTANGKRLCKSNDPHVVALARVSGARVLCSADQDLHVDFKNLRVVPSPKGRIYQNAAHANVLGHTSGCIGRPRK